MARRTLKPWGTKRKANIPNAGRGRVAPAGDAKAPKGKSEASAKTSAGKYTKEELENLDMKELRAIGRELEVSDRSKAGLIRQILRES